MRKSRIKLTGRTAVYHCMSRIVGGEFLLDEPAQEQLRIMLRQQADFCGIQIITHSELSNHFHAEVRVIPPGEISDQELLRRAEVLYSSTSPILRVLRQALTDHGVLPEDLRQRLRQRMGEVSVFMKELKQRFSRWYNREHDRYGTLWAERFKSVLVEDAPDAVGTVAAYIDLNAVRAGLVPDPKEYRFCGYGEAVSGNEEAQAGLLSFLEAKDWEEGGAEYRCKLFVEGGTAGQSGKVILSRQEILKVLENGGKIGCGEALRLRIRYFRDGLVLGSEGFVNEIFAQFRDRFGSKRKTGARKLRQLPFEGLRTMRDLRKNVLS
jgi:putative transposase